MTCILIMSLYARIPFLRFFISFSAGIVLCNFLSPGFQCFYFLLAALTGMGLSSILFRQYTHTGFKKCFAYCNLLFFVSLGAVSVYLADERNSRNHYTAFAEADSFVAFVSETPQKKTTSFKTEVKLLALHSGQQWIPVKGRLLVYLQQDRDAALLHYGSLIRFKTSLKQIEEPLNPGEFDYRQWLKRKNIFHSANPLVGFSLSLQKQMSELLHSSGLTPQQYAIADALLLGNDNAIDNELLNSYAHTGTLHILSVSGLHVGTLCLLLNFLLAFADKNRKLKLLKHVIILCALVLYAFISGLSPSVVRAVAMFGMLLIGKSFFRDTEMYNTLFTTAFFILLFQPQLLYDTGFQLSYLAVLGIVYFYPRIYHLVHFRYWATNKVWEYTALSIAAQITTLPLSLYYFHQFPTLFVLSNLLIIPLSNLIMYTGILLLALSPFKTLGLWVAKVLGLFISLMNKLCIALEQVPGAYMDNIYFDDILLLITCGLIFLVSAGFYQKSYRYTVLGFLSIMLSFTYSLWVEYVASAPAIFVYNIKGRSVIDIMNNRHLYCLGSLNSSRQEQWHCRNNRIRHVIRTVRRDTLPDGISSFSADNRKIIIVNNYSGSGSITGQENCDALLVCGSESKDAHLLLNKIRCSVIIADGSINKSELKKLKQSAPEKLWATDERGAYMFDSK